MPLHWVQLNLKSREIAKEIFAVQIGVGSLSILIIVGILFSTLPNDDLVGVWRNDVYTLTLSEDGSATDNNQDFGAIGWYSDSDSLYLAFEDKPDVYYHFIYELEGDILYIALVDESYEVMPDTCSILVKYDTPISVVDDATIPSWCS